MSHPFIAELRALLEKHDVVIYVGCDEGSDLHGVTGEEIIFSQREPGGRYRYTDLLKVDGWSLSASDIK